MSQDHDQPLAPPPVKRWFQPHVGWLVLLGGAAAGAAYLLTAPTPSRRPSEPRQPLVTVQALQPSRHCVAVEAHGRVEPVNRISLLPQVSGRVRAVHRSFVPGGRIPANQDIVVLEDADYQAALQQARAEQKTAQEELRLADAEHRTAVDEWEKFGDRKVSGEQRDLATRVPQKRIKEAAVEKARARLRLAEIDLRRTRIRFSFPVVIESIAAGEGSVARTGTALGVAYPLHMLWINVALPVRSLRWFSPRQHHATIWPRGVAGPLRGEIREIRPDVERQGSLGQLLVEVPLDGAGERKQDGRKQDDRLPMRAGEFVRLKLHGACLERVFALPRRAVRGERRVWLAGEDRRLQIRTVSPLFVGRDVVLVRDGLRPGQRLITSQLSRPVAGMQLRIKDSGAAPDAGAGKTAALDAAAGKAATPGAVDP